MTKHPSHPSLFQYGIMLILMHFRGYVPVEGYTLAVKDDPWKGARYVAIAMEKPE